MKRIALWAVNLALLFALAATGAGQGASAVFVAAPELGANQKFGGTLARADFNLQGIVPIASALSFPTALSCTPDGTLLVAEFALRSAGQPNDTPETRIVRYGTDGQRGPVVGRVPEAFVVGIAQGPTGSLWLGTGVFPGVTEFSGIWRVNPNTPEADAVQVVAPSNLQELLDLLETVVNPRDPEVRSLAFVPQTPAGRPFAGELLFTAGAGTLLNWDLYRLSPNGGAPAKVTALGRPWHAVASGAGGEVFLADFANGALAAVDASLATTTPFAELVQPFQLAVDAQGTLYVTTNAFPFDDVPASGKKNATLWRFDRFGRLAAGAAGAWGVTVCE